MNVSTHQATCRAIDGNRRRGTAGQRGFAIGRLLFWIGLGVWWLISWTIAGPLSDNMRVRINDPSKIPGAGLIMRDPEGTFYHVNGSGRGRAVFPKLAPPVYAQVCLDCVLVNGEQLSQTSDFCISGIKKTWPAVDFEIPCRTWTPMGESQKVLAFIIFAVPIAVFWVVRNFLQSSARKKKKG